MQATKYARKLDSVGRLVIPSRLREELRIEPNETFTFYTHEAEGKIYLCIECPTAASELEKAMELLEKNGY